MPLAIIAAAFSTDMKPSLKNSLSFSSEHKIYITKSEEKKIPNPLAPFSLMYINACIFIFKQIQNMKTFCTRIYILFSMVKFNPCLPECWSVKFSQSSYWQHSFALLVQTTIPGALEARICSHDISANYTLQIS